MKKFKVWKIFSQSDLGFGTLRPIYSPYGFIKANNIKEVVNNLYGNCFVSKTASQDIICHDMTGKFDYLVVTSKTSGNEIFKLDVEENKNV